MWKDTRTFKTIAEKKAEKYNNGPFRTNAMPETILSLEERLIRKLENAAVDRWHFKNETDTFKLIPKDKGPRILIDRYHRVFCLTINSQDWIQLHFDTELEERIRKLYAKLLDKHRELGMERAINEI